MDWCLFDYLNLSIFHLTSISFSYVKRIKTVSWGGGRKCGAFLSCWDRDPHPTCTRCRGKICTKDMTCDFCVNWSPAQWELFAQKRSYKERKKSRPSGSVPPAPGASPRAGTPSGVLQPGTSSSSFSRSSGVVSREVSSPPVWPRSSERGVGGGSVSGHSSVACERASVSSAPLGAGEGEVAQSPRTPPARAASSVASPRSSPHARRRGELREVSEDRSRVLSSRGSRSSDRGARKDRRPRFRSDSSRDRGRRSRSCAVKRSRVSKAVILSVAVLLRAVAIFGSLLLSTRALSFSGRPVAVF